jgi:uncharacterized protein HemY
MLVDDLFCHKTDQSHEIMGRDKKGTRKRKKGVWNLRQERNEDFSTGLLQCWSSVSDHASEKKRLLAI